MVLTIVDQGASSVSNFALALIVAHYSSASALGVFAILTATYVLSQGLVRSLSSDCLLDPVRDRRRPSCANYERGGYLAAIVLSVSLARVDPGRQRPAPERVHAALRHLRRVLPPDGLPGLRPLHRDQPLRPCVRHPARRGLAGALPASLYVVLQASRGSRRCPGSSGPGAAPARWSASGRFRAHFARARRRQLLRFWDAERTGVGLRFAGQFMLVTSWTYFVSYLLLFVLPLASIGVFKLSQLALGPITVLLAGVQSALIALATKRFQVDPHTGGPLPPRAALWAPSRSPWSWTGARLRGAAARHGEPVRPQLAGGPGDRALRGARCRVRQLRQCRNLGSARPCGPPARTCGWPS